VQGVQASQAFLQMRLKLRQGQLHKSSVRLTELKEI